MAARYSQISDESLNGWKNVVHGWNFDGNVAKFQLIFQSWKIKKLIQFGKIEFNSDSD